eukprot:5365364-Amphidinium_carterae.2
MQPGLVTQHPLAASAYPCCHSTPQKWSRRDAEKQPLIMEPTSIEESAEPPLLLPAHMQLLESVPKVQGQCQDPFIGSRSAL